MPTGTSYIQFYSNPGQATGALPDGGASSFLGHIVLNEGHPQWDASWATFINGLAVVDGIPQDLLVTHVLEESQPTVAHGTQRIVQGEHPELVLAMGLPRLSADGMDIYRLWRGVPAGPFENKAGCAPAADGYFHYVPMEDSAGYPVSWLPTEWEGVASGDLIYQSVGGLGKALGFGGTNGQLTVYSWSMGTNFTLEFWMVPLACDNYASIFSQDDQRGLFFRGQGGNRRLDWIGYSETYSDQLTFGVPVHVMLVSIASPASVTIYVNGLAAGSSDDVRAFAPTRMGDDQGGETFRGTLDELVRAHVSRSADWVTTRAKMVMNNAAFWTIEPQSGPAGGPQLLVPPLWGRLGPSLAGRR